MMPFTPDEIDGSDEKQQKQNQKLLPIPPVVKPSDIGNIGDVMKHNAEVVRRIMKKIKPDWDGKIYAYSRYLKMNCPKHAPDKDPSLSMIYKQGTLWVFDWHADKYGDPVSMPFTEWIKTMTDDPDILVWTKEIPSFTYGNEKDAEWELLSVVQEVVSSEYLRFDGSYDATSGSFFFLMGVRTDYDIDIGRKIISSLTTLCMQAFQKYQLSPPSDYKLKQLLRNVITSMTEETDHESAIRHYYDMHKRATKECNTEWGQSIPFRDIEILLCEDKDGNIIETKVVDRDPQYVYFHTIPYNYKDITRVALSADEVIKQFDEITGGAGPFLFDEMARLLTPGIRRIVPINIGVPKAGKSYLAQLLKVMIGDKRVAIGLSTNKAFTLQGTLGKVIIILDEFIIKDSNAPLIKLLSGGDEVAIEDKYQPIIRIPNPYRLVVNINHILPQFNEVMEVDDALRSRMLFVPFFVRHQIKDVSPLDAYKYIPALIQRGIELLRQRPMYRLDYKTIVNIFGIRGDKENEPIDPVYDGGNILEEFLNNEVEQDDNSFVRPIDIYYSYVKYTLIRNKRPLGVIDALKYIATKLSSRYTKNRVGTRGYKVNIKYDWKSEFEKMFARKEKEEVDDIQSLN